MKRRQSRKCELLETLLKRLGDKPSPYQEDILVNIYEEEIEERLEALSECIGREITDRERRGLLDIVSKYTPRDKMVSFLLIIFRLNMRGKYMKLKKKLNSMSFYEA